MEVEGRLWGSLKAVLQRSPHMSGNHLKFSLRQQPQDPKRDFKGYCGAILGKADGRDEREGAHVVGESRHDQARIIAENAERDWNVRTRTAQRLQQRQSIKNNK